MNALATKRKPDLCNPTLIGLSMHTVYQNGSLKSSGSATLNCNGIVHDEIVKIIKENLK